MNSHGRNEQQIVWSVVGTDIGPLLLAATPHGLVNVVFHASDTVRDKARDRRASTGGPAPRQAPRPPRRARARSQLEGDNT
ncbi:cysteine methyltransferase, partial [Streptomyces sp. NPDC059371]